MQTARQDASSSLVQPTPLDNHGNTCYLNSGLQALIAIPSLQSEILNDEIYQGLRDKYVTERKMRTKCVLLFWNVARKMIQGEDFDFLPSFIRSVWTIYPHLSEYTQQVHNIDHILMFKDSVEFVQLLLDMIHEELKEEIKHESTIENEEEEQKKESTSPSRISVDSPLHAEPALSYLHPTNEKVPNQKFKSPISERVFNHIFEINIIV
jgi:ubiquitin C-terminal hydrolase